MEKSTYLIKLEFGTFSLRLSKACFHLSLFFSVIITAQKIFDDHFVDVFIYDLLLAHFCKLIRVHLQYKVKYNQ